MENISEDKWAMVEQVVKLLKTCNTAELEFVLTQTIRKLDIGVVASHSIYKTSQLICDPIIWTSADLESYKVSKKTWDKSGYADLLSDRSIEEGHVILDCIIGLIKDEPKTS
jgi:hypothetical protein